MSLRGIFRRADRKLARPQTKVHFSVNAAGVVGARFESFFTAAHLEEAGSLLQKSVSHVTRTEGTNGQCCARKPVRGDEPWERISAQQRNKGGRSQFQPLAVVLGKTVPGQRTEQQPAFQARGSRPAEDPLDGSAKLETGSGLGRGTMEKKTRDALVEIVRCTQIGLYGLVTTSWFELKQVDAVSPWHKRELVGELRTIGIKDERIGWVDQVALPGSIMDCIRLGGARQCLLVLCERAKTGALSLPFALDIGSLHSRIGFTLAMQVCQHERTEVLYRRDGVDYVRCLGCGQVFEAEDLEAVPFYDEEEEEQDAQKKHR